MKTHIFMLLLVLTASLPACASSTPSVATNTPTPDSAAQLEKVRLRYGFEYPSITMLPIDVAQALDLFKQEGLDVTINYGCRTCGPPTQGWLGGNTDFAGLGIDEALREQGGNRELQMVVAFARFVDVGVLVRSDLKDKIKTFADLKGQKITYWGYPKIFPYFVVKAGLKPEDVQFVRESPWARMPEVLQGGDWVAICWFEPLEPYATSLIKSGKAYAVVDLATESDSLKWLGGEFPDYGLVASTDTIRNRPQTVQKMVNAVVKALRYIATHSAGEIAAILPKEVTGADKALFTDALEHAMPIFSKDGTMTEAGVKNVVEVNRALNLIPPDQQVNLGALYTNQFVNSVK